MLVQLIIEEVEVELLIIERTLAIVFPPNVEVHTPSLPWLLAIIMDI